MKELSLLTIEEYSKLCESIPCDMVIPYLKRYPKEFSKIYPGFRVTALKSDDVRRILIKNRNKDFISSFIEKTSNRWISEIMDAISEYKESGESEIVSYIHALSQSYFLYNISAFFKLIDDNELSQEQINMIEEMIMIIIEDKDEINEYDETLKKCKEELKWTKKELEAYEKKINSVSSDAEKRVEKLSKKLSEKKEKLQKSLNEYDVLKKEYSEGQQQNTILTQNNKKLEERVAELDAIINRLTNEKLQLESSIREKIEEEYSRRDATAQTPMMPIDIEEFEECLGYQFEDVGFKDPQLKNLLVEYISKNFFCGKPIVCDRSSVRTLASCVSNALIGTTKVEFFKYTHSINEKDICNFLETSGRIVVLDNFIGNYNDSLLMSIVDGYKGKIIFLTFAYHKTMKYVSEEFLSYCKYVDVTWLPVFSLGAIPDEEPTIVDETENTNCQRVFDNRFVKILKVILIELSFCDMMINSKICNIENEQDLCELLLFDVIPYSSNVFSKLPMNYSQRLFRYIEKSQYASLFKRW